MHNINEVEKKVLIMVIICLENSISLFKNFKLFINTCNIYGFLVTYIGKKCQLVYIYTVISDV